MIKDAQGQIVSGATAESVEVYDQAVRAYNLGYGDSPRLFDAAREASPDFAMAHLGKAWLFTLANDPSLLGQARSLIQSAAGLTLNEREHAHLAALQQATAGARGAAASVLDRHLMRYPFDLVAHQAVTLLDGYLGRFRWVRDRTARALPFWSKDQPGYASILAFHGFGLEEAGDYSQAEDESRAAAELEPHSFWPHHTVSHVMEMTGRPQDGLGWMMAREPLWSAPGISPRSISGGTSRCSISSLGNTTRRLRCTMDQCSTRCGRWPSICATPRRCCGGSTPLAATWPGVGEIC